MKKALKVYSSYYMKPKQIIEDLLQIFEQQEKKMAVWGAGLKGEAFLNIFDNHKKRIQYVYDIDIKKHGKKTKSGHIVVDYQEKEKYKIDVIFLMNSVYENEVAFLLKKTGIEAMLINLDSMIEGELTAKEIIKFYMEGNTK